MTRLLGVVLVAGALAAGCSMHEASPSASPAFTPQAECERNGGWWHADMSLCEYQSPGLPRR